MWIGRSYLVAKLFDFIHPKQFAYMDFFALKDARANEPAAFVTNRAQTATCVFCFKQIASWGKRIGNQSTGTSSQREDAHKLLRKAIDKHGVHCGERWMFELLAKWSTNRASVSERRAIQEWYTYATTYDSEHVWRMPDKATAEAHRALFLTLPMIPDSEGAISVEVTLHKLAALCT